MILTIQYIGEDGLDQEEELEMESHAQMLEHIEELKQDGCSEIIAMDEDEHIRYGANLPSTLRQQAD